MAFEFDDVLELVGLCFVVYVSIKILWKVTNAIRIHFLSRVWKTDLRTYGKWAVVTGSSDGIGKAYALELAKRGMNVLLISRTLSKLENVAKEIKSLYGVETDIMAVDFANGRPVYDEIANKMQDKDIGILVNNVGLLAELRSFGEMTEDDIWASANVNVASVPAMTRLVLPRMLEKKRGAIINISSIGSHFPIPYMQMYAATKAYVTSFTRAVECEYSSSGITIQCIEPGAVVTNMTTFDPNLDKPSFFVPNTTDFAAGAVSTIGYSNYTTGYWTHGLQVHIFDLLSKSFVMNMMKRNLPKGVKKTK